MRLGIAYLLSAVSCCAASKIGDWAQCQQSCKWQTLGFTVNTSKAKELYRGCEPPSDVRTANRPSLVVIGIQKGGTGSLTRIFRGKSWRKDICWLHKEGDFWSQWRLARRRPAAHIVKLEYFDRNWKHCRDDQARAEKTPELFNSGWAPLRMCEGLGQQKLLLLLRNPVHRALSGFYQSSGTTVLDGISGASAMFFDMYARIEVALVKECAGLPSGNPEADWHRMQAYESCCKAVSKRFLSKPWPGCQCRPSGPRSKYCTHFGHVYANAVRRGIYVHFLKFWFTYHRAEDIVIYKAEDFFEQQATVVGEIGCFAKPSIGCEVSTARVQSINSQRTGHEPMWNSTRRMLMEFYEPYNKDLDQLLGREMNWW